jgi:hypothetical protein
MTNNELLPFAIAFFALVFMIGLIATARIIINRVRANTDHAIADAVSNMRATPDAHDDIARVIADDHIIEALRLNMPIPADDRDAFIDMLEALRNEARDND